ncbi:MAG: hypothetical protein LLG04_00255, partial [Parachlamydia sp.]|nr:hypothetical protein [Parachlamydia sp.]
MRFVKLSLILSICCCATLTAEDEFPTSIGVIEEAEQLNHEISTMKAEALSKIAVDPNYSIEIKNKAIEQLDKMDVSYETIQKIAKEQGISETQKQKI